MRVIFEDFNYKGRHYDSYTVNVEGIEVDDFMKMNLMSKMNVLNRFKDQIKRDFEE